MFEAYQNIHQRCTSPDCFEFFSHVNPFITDVGVETLSVSSFVHNFWYERFILEVNHGLNVNFKKIAA
jgi:hypothetical protein